MAMSGVESWSLGTLKHADRGVHEEFVHALYGPLFRWLHWLCGDREEAADLTQQTFVGCWESLARADPSLKAKVWLFAIGRNTWRNALRSRLRDRSVSNDGMRTEVVDSRTDSALEAAMTAECANALRHAVADLPEDVREAVSLRYWADLSYADIAATLSITPELARQRTFVGRNQLRGVLKAWAPNTC